MIIPIKVPSNNPHAAAKGIDDGGSLNEI